MLGADDGARLVGLVVDLVDVVVVVIEPFQRVEYRPSS